jgi:hypothetical protein
MSEGNAGDTTRACNLLGRIRVIQKHQEFILPENATTASPFARGDIANENELQWLS